MGVVLVHAGGDEDVPQAVPAPDAVPEAEQAQVACYIKDVDSKHGESFQGWG